MGLAFLNKKSWHPGSIKNIQKVSIAQEMRAEYERKAADRMRRIKEEREDEEIKRLQVQAGLLPASALDRQDWIYKFGETVQDQVRGPHLLAKPVFQGIGQKCLFAPLLKESRVNSKNEEFTKLHEDPMFLLNQAEVREKEKIVRNPIRMREIYKEIEGKPSSKNSNAFKKDKEDRKGSEKRRKDRSSDQSESPDRKRDRRRRRRRDSSQLHEKRSSSPLLHSRSSPRSRSNEKDIERSTSRLGHRNRTGIKDSKEVKH